MFTLKNRFAELLAEKERRTGQRWTYEEITRATGIAASTLSAYANNKVRRFDAVTVEALLAFLECEPGDFFVLEETPEGQFVAVA